MRACTKLFGRQRGAGLSGVFGRDKLDAWGVFEADTQQDIEFALSQMKAETLDQINQALSRLDEGANGYCVECGEEIPERRLCALPLRDSVQGLRRGAGGGGGARRRLDGGPAR